MDQYGVYRIQRQDLRKPSAVLGNAVYQISAA